VLRIFGRIFKMTNGPTNDDGLWRTNYNDELCSSTMNQSRLKLKKKNSGMK
jgi:hypothetical protein